jgi:hypothetical protein
MPFYYILQPTLASVFQLLERIGMNMVEEQVVTIGFNKENPRNFPTPSSQQSQSQPTKATPPKVKGANQNYIVVLHFIQRNKVEKTNV